MFPRNKGIPFTEGGVGGGEGVRGVAGNRGVLPSLPPLQKTTLALQAPGPSAAERSPDRGKAALSTAQRTPRPFSFHTATREPGRYLPPPSPQRREPAQPRPGALRFQGQSLAGGGNSARLAGLTDARSSAPPSSRERRHCARAARSLHQGARAGRGGKGRGEATGGRDA